MTTPYRKPEPDMPPPMPQYAANEAAKQQTPYAPIYPTVTQPDYPMAGIPDTTPRPERKRYYLLAPLNPRTYALLMYFFLWNFPFAIIACWWVNFTFWFGIATMPLCCVGIGLIVVFSWTWRALCALEVFVINCISPPSSGPIQRCELTFAPHLKNPLTWLSVPYWCFFKIIWTSLVFTLLVAFYWGTLICLLSPFFYFFGVGMECKECTGIWVVFVHVPLGILGFWITTVLTLLLGTAEAEIIKMMNTKRDTQLQALGIFTQKQPSEETPILTQHHEEHGFVIPNTTLVHIAKEGTTGSRLCVGIGCGCCLAVTAFMMFLGLTGVAALHCSEWEEDERVLTTIATVEIHPEQRDTFGVDLSGFSPPGSGFWGLLASGHISVETDTQLTDTVKFQVQASTAPGHHIALSNSSVDEWLDNNVLTLKSNFVGWVKQMSACSQVYVTVTIPKDPSWGNYPLFKVRGSPGIDLRFSYSNAFIDSLSGVDIHTKGSRDSYTAMDRYDRESSYIPRGTWWIIDNQYGDMNFNDFQATGNVTITTRYGHIDAGTVVCASCFIETHYGYLNINKINMSNPKIPSNIHVQTRNSDISLNEAVFSNTSTNNFLSLYSRDGSVDVTTFGYFGSFQLNTKGSWSSSMNIDKHSNTQSFDWQMNTKTQTMMSGSVLPEGGNLQTNNALTATSYYGWVNWDYYYACGRYYPYMNCN